jgi:hypothetical protein
VRLDDWFLTAAERGNPATRLDHGRGDGVAWSTGNEVRPLIHGAPYFAELLAEALAENLALHLIAVLPRFPDQDGKLSLPPNLVGRVAALEALYAAGGDRVGGAAPARPGNCAAIRRHGCRHGRAGEHRCPTA